MTPFEIASLALGTNVFLVYVVLAIIGIITIFTMVWVVLYPNSQYALDRKARRRARALLRKAFDSFVSFINHDTKIQYKSLFLSEEDKLVFDLLLHCKWTTNYGDRTHDSFTFNMSEHFYKVKLDERVGNLRKRKLRKLARDLSPK